MIWALINYECQIINIIEYDGEQDYRPPKGIKLVHTDDEKSIGDIIEP